MNLQELGPRLCIMGPSGSGKSTLAVAIGRRCGRDVVHLDQFRHLPGSDWVLRDAEAFERLHADAIADSSWVIEGNYTSLLASRVDRATGLIVLDVPTAISLHRYLRRSWFERDRAGALAGGRDSVKWAMLRHIAIEARANRRRYRRILETVALPTIFIGSTRTLNDFYRANDLQR